MAGPYSQIVWSDQFEAVAGTDITDEYSFEVPFDCILRRASAYAMAATASAYVTVHRTNSEGTDDLVPAGPGGDRNLKALDDDLDIYEVPDIELLQGDRVTVRIHAVGVADISRCKVVLSVAQLLERFVAGIGYYGYGYGY